MASIIDKHPQKQQIIDAILARKSLRDIAATTNPPVSFHAIQRYKNGIVIPALKIAPKIMEERNLLEKRQKYVTELTATAEATKAVMRADPILEGIKRRRELSSDLIEKAAALNNFNAFATVCNATNATDRLEAELTGRLAQPAGGTTVNQLVVVIPGWQAGDQAPEPSIDVTSESID